jgi:alpha-tubulin suppressor-like RCC1 family protein
MDGDTTKALEVPGFYLNNVRRNVTDGTCSYSFTTFVTESRHIFVCGQNWLTPYRTSSARAHLEFNGLDHDDYITQISGGSFHVTLLTAKGFAFSGGEPGSKIAQFDTASYFGFKKITLLGDERIKIVRSKCDHTILVTESDKIYLFGMGLKSHPDGIYWNQSETLHQLVLPNATELNPKVFDISLGRYAVHIVCLNEVHSIGNNENGTLNISDAAYGITADVTEPICARNIPIYTATNERLAVSTGEYHCFVYAVSDASLGQSYFFIKLNESIQSGKFSDVEIYYH